MRQGDLRHPEDKAALIEKLVRGSEAKGRSDDAPFETYRELFIFAACVGFAHNRRSPVTKTDKDPIRWSVLTHRQDFEGLLYLFGIAGGDTMILSEEQTPELLRLFEAYSNGGLEVIEDWLTDASGTSPREVISTHVLSQLNRLETVHDSAVSELFVPEL